MKPSARLQTLIDFLTELEDSPKPADSLLSAGFRARRYIGSKDRADIANRFYRVLRHYARYHWHARQHSFEVTPRILTLIDVAFYDREEFIDLAFDGEKYGTEKLTATELQFFKALKKTKLTPPAMPEDVAFECPDWLYTRFKGLFDDRFAEEMTAMLEPASLHLRINPIKGDRETIQKELHKDGIKTQAGELSPWALIVDGRPALSATKSLQEGYVEIQDEGSQLIALMTGAKPGVRVVDFCSGAGGKTLAMAGMMNNKGQVVACDVLEGKLKRAKLRYRRAGIHNAETRLISTERDKWVKRSAKKFDIVLTDAPCSGTGTWKRNPDMRWRFKGPDLDELLKLQTSILDSASRLVKPEGRLVYATCSLLPEENENQVRFFLKNNPDFSLQLASSVWENELGRPAHPAFGEFMALTPALSNTDGFFAAIMTRAPAPEMNQEISESVADDSAEAVGEDTPE